LDAPAASLQILLSVEEMYAADAATIAQGVPGTQLMEAAGTAVAGEIRLHWSRRPTLMVCGPGNNGGDGFVAARLLAEAGWPVRVALLGSRERLAGDAALAAARWQGPVEAVESAALGDARLVVDAVFGAGLARPFEGPACRLLREAEGRALPIVAIDVPSGVDGNSGEVRGYAAHATRTVTFVRKKPGHMLLPGRERCGAIRVAEIGTPAAVADNLPLRTWENHPNLWRDRLPRPTTEGHKYTRGYATVVSGGAATTGAARLAAEAALRCGAGLVGIACPPDALAIIAASTAAVMTNVVASTADLAAILDDRRRTGVLLGPGNGLGGRTRDNVLAVLSLDKPTVLDADALTVFAEEPTRLFRAIRGPTLMTPHEGEFARLFPELRGSKLERARMAARRSGATVLLKGPDTVVAAPDGRAVINGNAPPWLATAGAGDVLAGCALGLMTAGLPPFEAAAAAAWFHCRTALDLGRSITSESLSKFININLL